jgi:hypothetical protein
MVCKSSGQDAAQQAREKRLFQDVDDLAGKSITGTLCPLQMKDWRIFAEKSFHSYEDKKFP